MSTHVFGSFLTANGTAANNRGENEGNITTLQKLVWLGQVHTTVSAEAIRFALRRRLAQSEVCNRTYDETTRANQWADPTFAQPGKYIDDDVLGFMSAEAAKEEGDEGDGKGKAKGKAKVRRAVLEVTRAVSLVPWSGDVTFNAASPGATPSAQKKGSNPVPYGTEMHATRYQYGIALTPERLVSPKRARAALEGLCSLGEVAGNHGRFLFDFSPESAVFRVTTDPAPRILYCFQVGADGKLSMPDLLRKVRGGDIAAGELVFGGAVAEEMSEDAKSTLRGASFYDGVRAACEEVCTRLGGKA